MRIVILATLLSVACRSTSPARDLDRSERPNIVVIFTDDQGYGDVGVYGAQGFETPNIDRLAHEGRRFTDFYVSQPVCSASRASLLTGCYANRIGIHGALGPHAKHGIAGAEITLGELCQSKGYRTAAFGKWHLGHRVEFLPTRNGFDRYYGIPYSNDMWPFHPESPDAWVDLPTIENERVVGYNTDQSRFTTDLTTRAVEFIDECAEADDPFFLYVAHPMPHVPLFVSTKFAGHSEQGMYGDVIEEIDWSVGQILSALDRRGLAEDTWVIFTSDNGPWLSYGNHAGTTGPLREGKGTTFEGGVRVPCVMRWPGRIPAGSVCAEPAMTIDVLPTVASMIDAKLPVHEIDGMDVSPLVFGDSNARSPHEAYYFWYDQGHLEAMRSGRWKLHFPHGYRSMVGRKPGAGGQPGKYDYSVKTGLELYDLGADVGESKNVAAEYPEVVKRLVAMADVKRLELGDGLTKIDGSANRAPGRVSD